MINCIVVYGAKGVVLVYSHTINKQIDKQTIKLRVESHPAHAKNCSLLIQKLLVATNGELYTAA